MAMASTMCSHRVVVPLMALLMATAAVATVSNSTTASPNTTVTNTTMFSTTTVATTMHTPNNDTIPAYWGYISCGVAVIFYGSNFVPVKKVETGDGVFFQWILCSAIFVVGVVVNLIRNAPTFYPIVMLGGAIWTTGNMCVVPVIKTIGLGLGICIWGTTNLVAGWAFGRFGLFGIKAEVPDNLTLNYIGVGLAIISGFIYLFVKTDVNDPHAETMPREREPLLSHVQANDEEAKVDDDFIPLGDLFVEHADSVSLVNDDDDDENDEFSRFSGEKTVQGSARTDILSSLNSASSSQDVLVFNQRQNNRFAFKTSQQYHLNTESDDMFQNLSPVMKRVIGCSLAALSGVFYGTNFTPAIYVQDNYKDASSNALDYIFPQFCGIYTTSTLYFAVYCIVKKNKPNIYPRTILPAMVSGIMWSIATIGWFIANKVLSEPVSFPIITTGPGFVSMLWGCLLFKEVKGLKNFLFLGLAFAFTISGAVLAGISKKVS